MDFRLSEDRQALVSAIDKIAAAFESKPTEFHGFVLTSSALEQELEAGQFFDIAKIPELGPLSAVMAVERLARLPFATEAALSMLVRPQLGAGDLPRPFAVVEHGRPGRFVAAAKTILLNDGDYISVVHPDARDTESADSIFAYPMGRLKAGVYGTPLSSGETSIVRQWLQIALAAEASGLLQAAVASAVDHITQRKQFGRPLGSFQALRHRMAECAVLAGGVKWLALKAAGTGAPGDAALAAYQAMESATRVTYDVHQMLAAMGMTLEHPLHLWTYRLKALLSEMGGRSGQALSVAEHCFGASAGAA